MTHPGIDNQPAVATHCRRCGQPIIQAVADGLTIRADPAVLDIPEQLAATLDRQSTYELLTYQSGYLELAYRSAMRIRYHPAATVIAAHRCPPAAKPLTWKQAFALPPPQPLSIRRTTFADGDEPPF